MWMLATSTTFALLTPTTLATRIARLATLDASERAALDRAALDSRRSLARREMIGEGDALHEGRAILSGWAYRQRILADGSRQILGLLMPGDLIGVNQHDQPLAPTSIVAITDVVTCPAPVARPGGGLYRAYAHNAAREEFFLLAQITRLGRLNAVGRMADWLLETHDRLRFAGVADDDMFPMPLTQELLADLLGLTSVHINRTLQAMRRDKLIRSKAGTVAFPDRPRLEKLVDYRPVRVSAAQLVN